MLRQWRVFVYGHTHLKLGACHDPALCDCGIWLQKVSDKRLIEAAWLEGDVGRRLLD